MAQGGRTKVCSWGRSQGHNLDPRSPRGSVDAEKEGDRSEPLQSWQRTSLN